MSVDSSIVTEAHEQYDIPVDRITTVSAIAQTIDQQLQAGNLQAAHVVGEVTNLREWRDHLFFSMKDEQAKLNVVVFNADGIDLEDGETILARGSIDFYQEEGKTSLKANTIFPLGEGTYYKKLRKRKKKLRNEGYFTSERQPPELPEHIAIIAGEDSDALHDVKDTIWARAPWVDLHFYPVSVQGDQAIEELQKAINQADKSTADTIIITRGGGDIEAFKPFNTKEIAETIDNTTTPIISGIGHRDDETIAGLTADIRGFTPTDAGEKATKDRESVIEQIETLEKDLDSALKSLKEQQQHEQELAKQQRQKRIYQAALIAIILIILLGGILL